MSKWPFSLDEQRPTDQIPPYIFPSFNPLHGPPITIASSFEAKEDHVKCEQDHFIYVYQRIGKPPPPSKREYVQELPYSHQLRHPRVTRNGAPKRVKTGPSLQTYGPSLPIKLHDFTTFPETIKSQMTRVWTDLLPTTTCPLSTTPDHLSITSKTSATSPRLTASSVGWR